MNELVFMFNVDKFLLESYLKKDKVLEFFFIGNLDVHHITNFIEDLSLKMEYIYEYNEDIKTIVIDITKIGTILSNSFFIIDHFINKLYTDIFYNKDIKTIIYHSDKNFLTILQMFLEEYCIDFSTLTIIDKNE